MAGFKKKKTEPDKKKSAYKKADLLTDTEVAKLKKTTTIRLIASAVFVFASIYFSLWLRNISGLEEMFTEDFSGKFETLAASIPFFDWNKYLNALLADFRISTVFVPIGAILSTAYNIVYRFWLNKRQNPGKISDPTMLIIGRTYAIMIYIIWFFVFACAFLYRFYRLAAYWVIDSTILRYGALTATLAIYIWIAFMVFFMVWHEMSDYFTISPLGTLHTENIGTYVLGIAFCAGASYFMITAAASIIVITAIKGIRSMRRKAKQPKFFDGFVTAKEDQESEEMIIAEKEGPPQIEDGWEEILITETDSGSETPVRDTLIQDIKNEIPIDEEWEAIEEGKPHTEGKESWGYLPESGIKDEKDNRHKDMEDEWYAADGEDWTEI